MRVIALDLDDTLYEELSFVGSGFAAVSDYLKSEFQIDPTDSQEFMVTQEKKGRGKIFDDLLARYHLYSKKNLNKLISIYRLHQPKIELHQDAKTFLKRFSAWPLYIVTDGNKIVQHNKIKALKLEDRVKKVFITHRYGRHNAKPSVYVFDKIAKLENAQPNEIVYIADDPSKDFVAIKKAGFKSIRILRGNHKDKVLADRFEADLNINSLDEVDNKMLQELSNE